MLARTTRSGTERRVRAGCSDTADRPRTSPRAGDHVSKSAGGLLEIAGSESAEDCVSGVRGPRIENTTRSNQGLLRLDADRISRAFDGQAARHSGRIEGQLRTAGAAGLDVSELFGAGERETRTTAPGERPAGLPG